MATQASCHSCVYARWDAGLWLRTLGSGFPAGPRCGNQPDSYGRMKECPVGKVCRNYRVRPPGPKGEAVKLVPLGDGLYAYVDAADFEWLNQWHWRVFSGGYAGRYEDGKMIYMHREIMKPPKGKVTDHINGNKFDNTRANLRNITAGENMHNKIKQPGVSSVYKGVCYCKAARRWRAQVDCDGKQHRLGYFDDEVEAARAYDYRAVQVFGECARPNFPEEWPARRRRQVHGRWLRERAKQKGF